MKLVNPLYYPLAVFAGGITLFVGVRLANVSSIIMLPLAAVVATGGAMVRFSIEPHPFHLDHPELERELQLLGKEVKELRDRATALQDTAREDVPHSPLFSTLTETGDRIIEIADLFEEFNLRLFSSDAFLSLQELQDQRVTLEQKQQQTTGIEKDYWERRLEHLQHHLELMAEGEDARIVEVSLMSEVIQEVRDRVETLHSQIQAEDLSEETQQLCDEIKILQDQMQVLALRTTSQ